MGRNLPCILPGVTQTSAQERCDGCGALMTWDARAAALRCDSCGATRAPRADGGAEVVEHDLETALRTKPRGRIGAGVREVKCGECGAVVELAEGVTASRCSFCDSPQVHGEPAREDHLAPESLVPFTVGREQSIQAFKGWIAKLWFRPSDLKTKASVSDLRGVYVPFWTFNADVASSWTADAGYHYYETQHYTENGQPRTRQVQRTRWEPAHGWREDRFEDVLVCASKGLPEKLVRAAGNFELSGKMGGEAGGLVTYSTDYLQGFSAESYALELAEAWPRARAEMEQVQESRCARDVPGDTHRFLRVNNRFHHPTFKHVLLPVWIAAFRYDGKVYRFLVNGQTGRVSGEGPLSWLKILLFSAVIAAIIVAIVLLVRR
jgi:hypothetical protein